MIVRFIMLLFAALAMFCMYKVEFNGGKKYYVAAVVNYSIVLCLHLIALYKEVF